MILLAGSSNINANNANPGPPFISVEHDGIGNPIKTIPLNFPGKILQDSYTFSNDV